MLSFLLKGSVQCLILAGALYGVFFIPLGQHTLYDHLARIAATEPAKELGTEVGGAVSRASQVVRTTLNDGESPPAD